MIRRYKTTCTRGVVPNACRFGRSRSNQHSSGGSVLVFASLRRARSTRARPTQPARLPRVCFCRHGASRGPTARANKQSSCLPVPRRRKQRFPGGLAAAACGHRLYLSPLDCERCLPRTPALNRSSMRRCGALSVLHLLGTLPSTGLHIGRRPHFTPGADVPCAGLVPPCCHSTRSGRRTRPSSTIWS